MHLSATITETDEKLKSVAHRVFYDFCVDGFMYNDYIESYGTDIHKRPEFIRTLIDLSDEAQKLDAYWKAKSKPYKVVFYATAEQIHKFTFNTPQLCRLESLLPLFYWHTVISSALNNHNRCVPFIYKIAG